MLREKNVTVVYSGSGAEEHYAPARQIGGMGITHLVIPGTETAVSCGSPG
jgi:hypothetical protein